MIHDKAVRRYAQGACKQHSHSTMYAKIHTFLSLLLFNEQHFYYLRTEKRRVENARTAAIERMVIFNRDSCFSTLNLPNKGALITLLATAITSRESLKLNKNVKYYIKGNLNDSRKYSVLYSTASLS